MLRPHLGCSSLALLLACGGGSSGESAETSTSDASVESSQGPGETSSSAATSSAEASSDPSESGSSTTAGGAACQGNDDCDGAEYCDFPFNSCGASNSSGTCTARPSDCAPDERPICGCNDTLYPSACDAASAGIDLAFLGQCEIPNGAFACGPSFCILGMEYCAITSGLEPTAACVPLPPACEPPTCTCMTECCGCQGASCCTDFCTADGEALTFTCPG